MNILFGQDQSTVKEKALHASMSSMTSMSSSQIVSASALHNKTSLQGLGLPAPVSYPPPVTTTTTTTTATTSINSILVTLNTNDRWHCYS